MKPGQWIPPAVYYLGLLLLSSIPPDDVPRLSLPGLDKLVHGILYTGLGLCLARLRWRFSSAWLLGAALAALDEAYQHHLIGRTGDWADWLADGIGLALGLTIATFFSPLRPPPASSPR